MSQSFDRKVSRVNKPSVKSIARAKRKREMRQEAYDKAIRAQYMDVWRAWAKEGIR